MGISNQDFGALQEAMAATGVETGELRMAELGAQYFQVDGVYWGISKKYFEDRGVIHTSFDVNRLHGARFLDLCQPLPEEHREAFDIVTNVGTSEHVVDQYACFSNIHDLCRPGGVILHSVPPPGHWPGHGRFYYPLEFFDGLARGCGYDVLHREITAGIDENLHPLAVVTLRRTDARFLDADAFAALPVVIDEDNDLVGNYIGRPGPLKRGWKNFKRILRSLKP